MMDAPGLGALRLRLATIREWLRGSLWVIPGLMTAATIALAFITVSLDLRYGDALRDQDLWFMFGVGPDGVRGVLSAIAGSIITVTGVVFSILIVALQLASSQYSPRVLRTFLEDRAIQVVLGCFIGTFTYSLLVLRTVRSESPTLGEFVPSLSVTVALALGLASVACLIFVVHHSAQSIRGAVIVRRLTAEARATALRAFPRHIGQPAGDEAPDAPPAGESAMSIGAPSAGYLNAVDENRLLAIEARGRIVIRMSVRLGDFVRTGDELATVEGEALDERARAGVQRAFVLGTEAAGEHDMALALIRLSEVATRALSPGINDIGTAGACLDAISEILVVLGERDAPHPVRASASGRVLLVSRYHGYDELLEIALGPIRHYGASSPPVVAKVLQTLHAVAVRVRGARRDAIERQAAAMRAVAGG